MDQQWKRQLPADNIQDIIPVAGGDVNDAYRVDTTDQAYFLLVQPNHTADFYAAEIAGLKEFQNAGVTAPVVQGNGEIDGNAYLLLNYLEEGARGSQRKLGHLVAKLHQKHHPDSRFGYDLPFEGGDISFDNTWTGSWRELFVNRRLDQLNDSIIEKGLWSKAQAETYQQVRKIIVETLEERESVSSLLHGDLWAGNYMFLTDGNPVLFDPAPLYGDREFDLGATLVFGGFTEYFYHAYQEDYPLDDGAWSRIQFYKLYLLMVHLVKFGRVYEQSVDRTMQEIASSG